MSAPHARRSILSSHTARSHVLLVATAIAFGGIGCQSSSLMTSQSQACVENALRRSATQEMVAPARETFRDGCASGEMEACSALGVLTEIGFDEKADAVAAAQLYGRACEGGNGRACANLGRLLERGALGAASVPRALPFYTRACDADDALGCTELARLYRDGTDVPKNGAMAAVMFDKACSGGEARACTASGDMKAAHEPDAALALFTRACLAGESDACDRLADAAPGGRHLAKITPTEVLAKN